MFITIVTRLYLGDVDVLVYPERVQMVKNTAVDVGPSETNAWPLYQTNWQLQLAS